MEKDIRLEENPETDYPEEFLSEQQQRIIDVIFAFNEDGTDSLYPTIESQAMHAISVESQTRMRNKYPEDTAERKIITYFRTKRKDLHWALQAGEGHPNYDKNKNYIDKVLKLQGYDPNSDFTTEEIKELVRTEDGGFASLREILERRV